MCKKNLCENNHYSRLCKIDKLVDLNSFGDSPPELKFSLKTGMKELHSGTRLISYRSDNRSENTKRRRKGEQGHARVRRSASQNAIAPRVEGSEVDTTRCADNPQAEVASSQRGNLGVGGGEHMAVENHAIPGLPHRPENGEDSRVAGAWLHSRKVLSEPVHKLCQASRGEEVEGGSGRSK
jgi:hypothetical protein